MRKLIIAAALVTATLTGAAGCADNSEPGTNPTSGAPASAAANAAGDETKAVCAEAISTSTAANTQFQSKFGEFMAAAATGDTAKLDSFEGEITKLAKDWKDKLTELSAKKIDADVKTALTDGVATVEKITSDDSDLTAAQLTTELTTFNGKLAAACA